MKHPFVSLKTFLDPELTSEERKERYKNLQKERYYISKFCNMSYEDTGRMAVVERDLVLESIQAEIKAERDAYEKQRRGRRGR